MNAKTSVDVQYPDNTPAENVPLRVEAIAMTMSGQRSLVELTGNTDDDGVFSIFIDAPASEAASTMIVKVKSANPDLRADQQAETELEILPYESTSRHYLWLENPQVALKVGQLYSIDMRVGGDVSDADLSRNIRYLIITKRAGLIASGTGYDGERGSSRVPRQSGHGAQLSHHRLLYRRHDRRSHSLQSDRTEQVPARERAY
ncbi:PREDICTED: uncharacterized protein LOC106811716 [Priapulus caudatus]|uniref:Uncharacterized protein LOC106811716 n=1 Tax=Priapulus caudatus TaxID=37621 RepID=A0ABM1EFD8_PRICU|nr:PREDICTED: uncharacterized protein LOC106811716 [Priapulus caudatus]